MAGAVIYRRAAGPRNDTDEDGEEAEGRAGGNEAEQRRGGPGRRLGNCGAGIRGAQEDTGPAKPKREEKRERLKKEQNQIRALDPDW